MDKINSEPTGFQQTQTTRVKDPGPAQDANPPPRKAEATPANIDSEYPPSPHPFRGQKLNTVA